MLSAFMFCMTERCFERNSKMAGRSMSTFAIRGSNCAISGKMLAACGISAIAGASLAVASETNGAGVAPAGVATSEVDAGSSMPFAAVAKALLVIAGGSAAAVAIAAAGAAAAGVAGSHGAAGTSGAAAGVAAVVAATLAGTRDEASASDSIAADGGRAAVVADVGATVAVATGDVAPAAVVASNGVSTRAASGGSTLIKRGRFAAGMASSAVAGLETATECTFCTMTSGATGTVAGQAAAVAVSDACCRSAAVSALSRGAAWSPAAALAAGAVCDRPSCSLPAARSSRRRSMACSLWNISRQFFTSFLPRAATSSSSAKRFATSFTALPTRVAVSTSTVISNTDNRRSAANASSPLTLGFCNSSRQS
mmetsp:Transcript_46987/g.93564  ORF Transcript_46987/g.93564 Transcript_46987/m.93564 type:complete len:368 (-) Transcript_46987:414-1517(-)